MCLPNNCLTILYLDECKFLMITHHFKDLLVMEHVYYKFKKSHFVLVLYLSSALLYTHTHIYLLILCQHFTHKKLREFQPKFRFGKTSCMLPCRQWHVQWMFLGLPNSASNNSVRAALWGRGRFRFGKTRHEKSTTVLVSCHSGTANTLLKIMFIRLSKSSKFRP